MLVVKKNSRVAINICSLTYWEAELSYAFENCADDVLYIRKCVNNIEYAICELNKFRIGYEVIKKCASAGMNWRVYFNSNEEDVLKLYDIMEYSEN